MERCAHYLPVILVLFIVSFFFSDSIPAQNASKKNYNTSYKESTSLKSSAVNNRARHFEHENDYPGRYIEIPRKEFDSYTRTENNVLNNKSKSSENYFHIDVTGKTLWDGKHWGDSNFPLKIYVKESSSRYYKSVYEDYVKYAMDVWRKTDDRIQYTFVKSIEDADVALLFVENLGDEYEENYLGITDYNTDRNKHIKFSKIQISLIKNGSENISDGEIKATIIHEFGHALGLGHSDNKNDLMYPYISPDHTSDMTYDELSKGDKLAVKEVINLCFEDNYVSK